MKNEGFEFLAAMIYIFLPLTHSIMGNLFTFNMEQKNDSLGIVRFSLEK